MTLIAAFRCDADGHQGVVVCADSQETYGDYRVAVDKIKPRDAGDYDLIIGGAGNVASLIDGQANVLEQNVKRWPSALDEEGARLRVERALLAYHKRQVELYPAEKHEKVLRFIICVRDKTTSEVYLWKTDGTTAERVEDFALLGWEEPVYGHEVRWLYRRDIKAVQAVLLGVHLLTLAKNSLYVGGDTQVIVVHKRGMAVENPDEVRAFEKRIGTFNAELARVVLACPDTSIEPEDFQAMLIGFVREAAQLHEQFCADAMVTDLLKYIGKDSPRRPYIKIPLRKTVEICLEEMKKVDAEIAELKLLDEAVPPSDSQTSEDQP